MWKKRAFKIIAFLIFTVFCNFLVVKICSINFDDIKLNMEIENNQEDFFQVFLSSDGQWSEENAKNYFYSSVNGEKETFRFLWEKGNRFLRFDIGSKRGNHTKLSELSFIVNGKKFYLDIERLYQGKNFEGQGDYQIGQQYLYIETNLEDTYFIYHVTPEEYGAMEEYQNSLNRIIKIGVCLILDLILVILAVKRNFIYALLHELLNNRNLIWNLSKNDFKTKYAGSVLGIVWAFIQPVVTILVYWAVFQFGLKSTSPVEGLPYVIWFVSGMVPWLFFSEALNNATNCFMEYSYLVKKVIFKISILPIVKVISSFFVHVVFLMFLLALCAIYKRVPGVDALQIGYYVLCMFILVTAISFATSAIIVFFKDFGQIINIFLQVGMWATPIVWPYTTVPEKFQWIVKLNPMFYIVEGYRDAFSGNGIWFWNKYFQTVYFWIFTGLMLVVGTLIFKRLKNHFADVL